MVGPTAQLVSLSLHLNARLRSIPTPPFHNSTTRYCELIRFLHASKPPRSSDPDPNWHIVANNPDAWLASLRDIRRALIVHEPSNDPRLSDRMSSAFVGGGGRWFLCLDRGQSFECWEPWWRAGNRQAPDNRIWQVHYARVVETYTFEPDELARVTAPIADMTTRLRSILTRIEAFARKVDQPGFADCFKTAQSCLDSSTPLAETFHSDIAPPGTLPHAAAQLLAANQHAWVFGGMGSWNDLVFDGDDGTQYNLLSEELFNALNQSICIAANQAAPP